jgi:hypothetical protein
LFASSTIVLPVPVVDREADVLRQHEDAATGELWLAPANFPLGVHLGVLLLTTGADAIHRAP